MIQSRTHKQDGFLTGIQCILAKSLLTTPESEFLIKKLVLIQPNVPLSMA